MKNNALKADDLANGQSYIWEKHYPDGINWNLEIEDAPLFSILDNAVKSFPNSPATNFLGKEYSYKELSNLIDKTVVGLQKMGVAKGTKIGLFMPNSAYVVVLYFAILKAGATVVNYNPLYAIDDLLFQIDDSETDIIVTLDVPELFSKVDGLLNESRLQKIIICPMHADLEKAPEQKIIEQSEKYIWLDSLLTNDGSFNEVVINPNKDIAVLQYTGGTTGVPKGAVLTHKNLYANTKQMQAWYDNVEQGKDTQLIALPLFHVFAMTVAMNLSVINAMRMYIMPKFDMKEALSLINDEKPEYFAAVPTIYNAFAGYSQISDYDFSSLKFCLSGGAPLPLEVKKSFEKNTGAKRVVEGYGLTESSPVATCNPVSGKTKSGSIGMPIPGTVIEIINPDDKITAMPIGEKGEVCISGPQVMDGYYNKPDATKDTIVNGRLHTGDIGYIDEEGYVYIVDRIKDLILVRGFNVYPKHVEDAIYKHSDVAECIVAGVPDKARGENVYAWIVAKEGADLKSSDIKEFIQDKLSPIEMPRKIIISADPLPKTAVGKLSRKDLLIKEGYRKA